MKRHLLLPALALFALGAWADDTHDTTQLKVTDGKGTETCYDVEKLVNITFDGEIMVITHADGTESFLIDDVQVMEFAVVSGIEEVRDFDLNDGLEVAVRGGRLTATLADGPLTLRVYDMAGRMVDTLTADGEIEYDLAALPGGTYVLWVNGKAIKFIR